MKIEILFKCPTELLRGSDKSDSFCWIYINYEDEKQNSDWSGHRSMFKCTSVGEKRDLGSSKLVDLYARPNEMKTNRVV